MDDQLPPELWSHVIEYLSDDAVWLGRTGSYVCQTWRTLCQNHLFKNITLDGANWPVLRNASSFVGALRSSPKLAGYVRTLNVSERGFKTWIFVCQDLREIYERCRHSVCTLSITYHNLIRDYFDITTWPESWPALTTLHLENITLCHPYELGALTLSTPKLHVLTMMEATIDRPATEPEDLGEQVVRTGSALRSAIIMLDKICAPLDEDFLSAHDARLLGIQIGEMLPHRDTTLITSPAKDTNMAVMGGILHALGNDLTSFRLSFSSMYQDFCPGVPETTYDLSLAANANLENLTLLGFPLGGSLPDWYTPILQTLASPVLRELELQFAPAHSRNYVMDGTSLLGGDTGKTLNSFAWPEMNRLVSAFVSLKWVVVTVRPFLQNRARLYSMEEVKLHTPTFIKMWTEAMERNIPSAHKRGTLYVRFDTNRIFY